jgi:alpha-tubulin suppressor-like RCC1 family protein
MATQDDINAFNASSTPACLLVLAAQTNNETANRKVCVATVNDLPDLSLNTIMPGTVLWVNSLNIPVIAQVGCWTGLDDREVRNDCLIKQVWSWGVNSVGQLGDNTTTSRSSPVSVVAGFTDWCQISAGANHTAAIRTSGSAWTWGSNLFGQLGDNTTSNKSSPVSVVGGFTDWRQIGAGQFFTVAVRTGGTMWSWGAAGALGDNNFTSRSSPVSVVGGFTDWCQVSAGSLHTVALRTGGSAWAWGCNGQGRLGDNTTIDRSSPVSVVGGFTNWSQVSGGGLNTVAIRTNGCAWAWGYNASGQVGDGTTTNRSSPVSVVGGFTDWCQVDSSSNPQLICSSTTVAVRTNGSAWSWGSNLYGRLGDNTTTNKSSPVSVVGGFTDWCQTSAGSFHSVAVRTGGSAWAWGNNQFGILGDNTTTNKSSPVSVVGGFTDWSQVSAGGDFSSGRHTVAIRQF